MKKNWLGIIKGVVLASVVTACVMVSAKDVKADASGNCGASVNWSYVDSTKTLTINGTGAMESGNLWTTLASERNYVENVIIESGVTSINLGAFSMCYNLKSVYIPSSVTTIGQGAFESCTSLTSVTIENGVKTIANSVFNGCIELTSITIPDSVESIGNGVFSGCKKLTSINIPSEVTSIPYGTFAGCKELTSITFLLMLKLFVKRHLKTVQVLQV